MIEEYYKLRQYQKEGVNFLVERNSALLADEMGLGKTVQTAVALNILFHDGKVRSSLIVCPTSLKFNWKKELNTWCPSLSVTIIKGDSSNRQALYQLPFHIWIASYEQVRNDLNFIIRNRTYDLVLLDEAQRIKNKSSSTSSACRLINRKVSWAISGTPLENNIEELSSLFSFVKFGTINSFHSIPEIKKNIKPYFLRRVKKEVLSDLPPILEQEIYMELLEDQQSEYDFTIRSSQSKINQDSDVVQLFSILTRLKQICNFSSELNNSVKYLQLLDIIDKAAQNKKKILLFSQYVGTLEVIQKKLQLDLNLSIKIYHGGLNEVEKDSIIQEFENHNESFDLLLISLKAGGVGLNLNSATIVVMFDMWWNPAVESQAIQRAHRFGKKEPLHVIRFIISSTIEERIKELLDQKKELFNKVITEDLNAETQILTKEDLLTILKKQNDVRNIDKA